MIIHTIQITHNCSVYDPDYPESFWTVKGEFVNYLLRQKRQERGVLSVTRMKNENENGKGFGSKNGNHNDGNIKMAIW